MSNSNSACNEHGWFRVTEFAAIHLTCDKMVHPGYHTSTMAVLNARPEDTNTRAQLTWWQLPKVAPR